MNVFITQRFQIVKHYLLRNLKQIIQIYFTLIYPLIFLLNLLFYCSFLPLSCITFERINNHPLCRSAYVSEVCNFVCAHREIPSSRSVLLKINTNACQGTETQVSYLEHVQAVITLNATRRGDVELFLTSPMGTRSVYVQRRMYSVIFIP